MSDTIQGYGMYLKKINDLLAKDANRGLRAHGLTLSQTRLLVTLHHAPKGEYTLKELEERFQVAQSTMAGIVSRLEQKGLITSYAEECDKRVKHVKLSPQGAALCDASHREIVELEARLTLGLSTEEKAQLLHLLRRVHENLQFPDRKDD